MASTDESLELPTISKEWISDVFIPTNGKLTEVELEIQEWNTVNNSPITVNHLLKNRWELVKEEQPEPPFDDAPIHFYERLKLTANNEVCIVSPGGIIGERKSYTHEDFDRDVKEQQTLETAAREAAKSGGPFSTHGQNYEYMFKLGAEWQKQQKPPRQLTTYDRDGY